MRQFYSLILALFILPVLTYGQYTVNSAAVSTGQSNEFNCFRLTPATNYQKGSVWNNTTINLAQSFEINARLNFGSFDWGGDGIAFMLQREGTSYTGNYGAGIGYHRFNGVTPPEFPADVPGPIASFIVEFDTYSNALIGTQNIGDPIEDHMGFMSWSNAYHTASSQLKAPMPLSANIEDGQYHDVKLTWNSTTKTFTVAFTVTASPLVIQTYSYTGDIVNTIFGGNGNVYWGFTASNGSFGPNEHDVCIATPLGKCGQLRTQTPGGWGAPPNGNNPGKYLHNNFSAAFPGGLTVGLTPGYNATFTSAQAITNYLPAGGNAQKMTQNYLNPSTTSLKNVLINHLVAVTLSVRFDQYDASFGDAGIQLGQMLIGSGPFAGWTVNAFLAEANKVAGGGVSSYTVQQVLNTAAAINENYDDGNSDNHYLSCPTASTGNKTNAAESKSITVISTESDVRSQAQFRTWPNPTSGQFEVNLGTITGKAEIVVVNSNGTVVERRTVTSKGQTVHFDLTGKAAGLYLVKILTAEGQQVQKLMVQK